MNATGRILRNRSAHCCSLPIHPHNLKNDSCFPHPRRSLSPFQYICPLTDCIPWIPRQKHWLTMEGEGLLVLAQAQMDQLGTMDPMDQEGARTTFPNERQLPPSEPHSDDTTAPVEPAASTQDVAAETKATTSLKARKRTKTGCLSKALVKAADRYKCSLLTYCSLSETPHQVRGGTANV